MPELKTLLVIAGPTAVGKTGLAISVAQQLGTSIVSADSRQCYRGMVIGTAQPSTAELAAVPHYFINEFPVETPLNAADYEQLALRHLDEIFATHDVAVVCGGTGLYVRALCEGLDEMPRMNAEIVSEVESNYQNYGLVWLQQALETADPAGYRTIDINNPARLIRALSFKLSTGQSLLDFQSSNKKERPFRIIKTALELPREQLYARINQRVDMMMNDGFLDEAKAFFSQRHLKNLQTVGYSELFDHLEGKTSLNEAVNLIKQHTRNYAKRQLTWFKKDKEFVWFQADDAGTIDHLVTLASNKNQ